MIYVSIDISHKGWIMERYYTGIGSNSTPIDILSKMETLGSYFAVIGYTLRSGNTSQVDLSFERGCLRESGKKEIWLPRQVKNKYHHRSVLCDPGKRHIELASIHSPEWDNLSDVNKLTGAATVGKILGRDSKHPVSFVLCWSADGCERVLDISKKTGNLGLAITLCESMNIPVFNLKNTNRLQEFLDYFTALKLNTRL